MGRVGEVVTRTWQVAHRMKEQRGPLDGDFEYHDNNRIKNVTLQNIQSILPLHMVFLTMLDLWKRVNLPI